MELMKKVVLSILILAAGTLPVQAKLHIVATVPDLADITRQVGGEWVSVESLAKGTEDIHAVPQRPSFVPKLNRADGVVLLGMEAEHAFLPALLEVAQNPNILRGRKGYIDCSENLAPREVPETLSRAEGELHPLGNPHYNVDPRKGVMIAATIAAGLSRLDPAHASEYAAHRDRFTKGLKEKIAEWEKLAVSVRGKKAVSYHKDMVYFADFLGLQMVNTVELKPGIAPTPTHLSELVNQMKAENVPLIIREVHYSDKTARWLAEQTGARLATVAVMGGAFADSQTFIGMAEHNVRAVVDALK